MKKRILSLLLALCLVVGMLPMVVLAEDTAEAPTSTLIITTGTNDAKIQWKPALSEGMAPAYAKTSAEGALVLEGATADDYNLKAEWPVDGVPTLTLNGATLANDTHLMKDSDPGVKHTIVTGGTADFQILLKGTNTINGAHNLGSTTTASHRMPAGIEAENTGKLTISSLNKAEDTLLIDNYGGVGIIKYYNALTIDSASIRIQMQNTGGNGQVGIVMGFKTAGREDMTDLTVRNSKLEIIGTGKYFGNSFIFMGETTAYKSTNTGDILFQNSVINLNRNNGTSSNSFGSETIQFSPNGSMTIDRCDFSIAGNHRTFNYAPTVINCSGVQYRDGWSNWGEYTTEPGTAFTANNSGLKGTHVCLAGEPVVNKPAGECATQQTTFTYCVICNKELSRVVEDLEGDPSRIHTPGEKTLLSKVDAKYDYTSDNKKYYKITEGTYTWQYTCSVCGEVWTETENFKPAILQFISSGEGAANLNSYGSVANIGTGYAKTLRNPGYTAYYVTKANDANYPDNRYLVAATADEIAAGTWNVKFEYPIGGDPVLTLRNAEVKNQYGLWYGYAGFRNLADLTVVLEGTNTFTQTQDGQGNSPFHMATDNNVTITGSGTLNIFTRSITRALGTYNGTLTLDNVNVNIFRNDNNSTSTREPCINAANVVINGGNLNVAAFGRNSYNTNAETGEITSAKESRYGYTNLIKATDITLNGANITAHGTFQTKSGIIYATGDLTVTESTLKLVHGYAAVKNSLYKSQYSNTFMCDGTVTFNYANGVTGKYSTSYTFADAHLDWETINYPTLTDFDSVDTLYTIETKGGNTSGTYKYLEVAPAKSLSKFTATSVTVNDSLDVNFAVTADKIADGAVVKFTVNGVETVADLADVSQTVGGYAIITLPGVSAKEMATEISVAVYDAEGNTLTETKTDSVMAYAMRMLRGDAPEGYTDEQFAKLKTALVDMLVYGAMAQVQFEHDTENLVTDDLTPAEWAYATADMQAVTNTPAQTEDEGYIGTTFILESNIAMAIAIDKAVIGANATAKVTFTSHDGTAKSVTLTEDATYSDSSVAVFITNDLVAADGRVIVTWEITKAGETEPTVTVSDSMANYVGRMVEANPYLELLMKYADATKAFFEATR